MHKLISVLLQAALLAWFVFRFDWALESQRAKALVAAGELVLEEEDELPLEWL